MGDRQRVHGLRSDSRNPRHDSFAGSPGKRTLTSLSFDAVPTAQPKVSSSTWAPTAASVPTTASVPTSSHAVQRKAVDAAALDDVDVDTIAANSATGGNGASFPHQEEIQASFGPKYTLSDKKAHVGGRAGQAARLLHARAYCSSSVYARPVDGQCLALDT